MPIIQTNSNYGLTYLSNSHKQKMPKKLKIFLVLIILAILIFLAFFLSNKLSTVFSFNNKLFNEKVLYALSVGEFESFDTAISLSSSLQTQGCAGFVFCNNQKYIVLLSCYETKNDAVIVMNNLYLDGVETEIVNIKLASFNIKGNLTKEQTNATKSALNSFYEAYKSLYKISANYDKNNITKVDCIEDIDALLTELESVNKSFSSICVTSENSCFVYLKVYLTELIDCVKALKYVNENFSGKIKYTFISCLDLYMKFTNEF